ncbi:MAG: hypothetical protein CVU79_08520 [Elusimicrobia bacterium HGW-Elusimicrobia-3]|nr:MAG: hypothetical protein CVU79_08520 [Elusimicrobia bacterium HGW-Elusimicrobia-3]
MDLPEEPLKSLSAQSVAYCLQRLSRASAGTWQVLDVKVSYGTFEDALKPHDFKRDAVAVYMGLRGMSPLTAMMVFDPDDIACVSKCYTGQSFHREGKLTPADEMLLVELGNVVINSLISALLNALKKSFMPTVPKFVEGGKAKLAGELLNAVGINTSFRIITVTLGMSATECSAKSEMLALIPEEMALELENIHTPPGRP